MYDLRAFFRAVGGVQVSRALAANPEVRTDTTSDVELIDPNIPHQISADPLEVAGWVDGIQAGLCITYRHHRPVYLVYVAAAALRSWGAPVGVREELRLYCSPADREWADEVGAAAGGDGIPIVELDAIYPPDVETAAHHEMAERRAALERHLVDELAHAGNIPLVVDGDLRARGARDGIVGVAKTMRTRFLPDEKVLYGMAGGWRSPRFRIAGAGKIPDRYSCYLRLNNATNASWSFGLVRLEAYDADLLDPLAATCLTQRQGPASGDGRWDRHLQIVRGVEEYLRARRPPVFSL